MLALLALVLSLVGGVVFGVGGAQVGANSQESGEVDYCEESNILSWREEMMVNGHIRFERVTLLTVKGD